MKTLGIPPCLYFIVPGNEAGTMIDKGVTAGNGNPVTLYANFDCAEDIASARGHSAIFQVDSAAMYANGCKIACVGNDVWNATKIPSEFLMLANGCTSDRFYSLTFRNESTLYDYDGNVILAGEFVAIIPRQDYIFVCLTDGGIRFYNAENNELSERYDNFYGYDYFGGCYQYSSRTTIDKRLCLIAENGRYGLFDIVGFRRCCECLYDNILPICNTDCFRAERNGAWIILGHDGLEVGDMDMLQSEADTRGGKV